MEYPLHLRHEGAGGFAVANTEAEHQSLSDSGYEPKLIAPAAPEPESIDAVRAKLEAAGIAYDKRWGLAKLVELLPKD